MLPTEIYNEIIKKIAIDSKQFLLDYLDIVDVLSDESFSNFSFILQLFLENFNNRIDIIDLTSSIDNSPIILRLKKFFTIKSFTTTKKEKLILLINDNTLYYYRHEINFRELFTTKIFPADDITDTSKFLFDIIYCPSLTEYKSSIKSGTDDLKCGYKFRKLFCNEFGQIVVPDLLNFLSFFPSNFVLDNLIIDFNYERILLSKDLLGILSPNSFDVENQLFCKDEKDQKKLYKEIIPQCKQITFSSVTYLLMDDKIKDIIDFSSLRIPNMSTIDSMGVHNREIRNSGSINLNLNTGYQYSDSYLNSKCSDEVHDFVQLYIPDLQDQKFYKNTCSNVCTQKIIY
ncbi:uncharacterized protein PWA37_004881 [Arxiozyma heterogenica]|uniref:uncharacterized protein n=1 Tax=Arxiozyma heterogenica TaxID=278026 RepID=UPI002EEBDD4B